MRQFLAFLAFLAALLFAAPAFAAPSFAAGPTAADWRLLDVAHDGDSAAVIDTSSVRERRDGKQARIAVIYDEQSDMAALEMTLVIDCVGGRERGLSVKLHDAMGKVFPQGLSKRFEKTNGEQPWHKYLCRGSGSDATLAQLGSDFPLVAVRKLLNDAALQTTKRLEQSK